MIHPFGRWIYRLMPPDLPQAIAAPLERFLAHGASSAAGEDALVIRRARGFALIGLLVIVQVAIVASFSHQPAKVWWGAAALLAFMIGGLALGCVKEARYIRLVTHVGMGSMLASIFGVAVHVGQGNDISGTFPVLLILVTTYVLGVRAGMFWTAMSIVGVGVVLHASDLPAADLDGSNTTRAGLFASRSIVLVGVMSLAAVERRFADRKSARIEFLARYDELTGLLRRRAFEERAQEALVRAERYQRRVAMVMVDLDRFKEINDRFGHDAGDEVLRSIGHRIAEQTRATDAPCRMGGDEFIILLEEIDSDKDVELFAGRLLSSIQEPIAFREHPLHVGASLGIATYPDSGTDLATLTHTADLAMYAAKEAGGDRVERLRSSD